MAASKVPHGLEKRKRSKKNKSRTVVDSSSSESDSDAVKPKSKTPTKGSEENTSTTLAEQTKITTKTRPLKTTLNQENGDVEMRDISETPERAASDAQSNLPAKNVEDFASIYLRKVTVELGDDLYKVREAKDFKSSSLPMLIHALKQGESIYSEEEKRRVTSAANS